MSLRVRLRAIPNLWGLLLILLAALLAAGGYAARRAVKLERLETAVASASSSLDLRLAGTRDYLVLLARTLGGGGHDSTAFRTRASSYVAQHRELINVTWVDSSLAIVDVSPREGNEQIIGLHLELPEPKRAAADARRTREPAYTGIFEAIQGRPSFEVWVPVYRGAVFHGLVAGVYSAEHLLAEGMPAGSVREGNPSLVTSDGVVVTATRPREPLATSLVAERPLAVPGLALRLVGYASLAVDAIFYALVVVSALLVFGAIWVIVTLRADARMLTREVDARRDAMEHLEREAQAHRLTGRELQLRAAALAAAADSVMITDVEGNIQWTNPAFTRTTGYEAAEVLGMNSRLLSSGQTPRAVYEELWRTIRGGHPWRGEFTNRRKDGKLFREELSITPIVDGDGAITHFVAVKQDVTEKERAAEELALMQRTIDSHPDLAVWYDSGNRIVFCNDAAATNLGYTRPELIGRPLADIAPRFSAERAREVWALLRRDDRVGSSSILRRKDGSEFPVEIITTHVFHGGVEYGCSFAVDVTERMRAAAERAALESRLTQSQKMESVGRLAGGVAHDFNNLLGVIMGNCEMALLHLDQGRELRSNLDEILEASNRSADLTRQLLAFARKQEIVPRVLDLNHAVKNSLRMLQRLIGADVTLRWQPGAELWPIVMDPSQLDQILANLCVNARDAIADTGTLVIATNNRVVENALRTVGPDARPGDYVTLSVTDDGCGMDAELLANVFEPFFTTKAIGQGTGLGLATVYGAVQQNGGCIAVRSAPGSGTTFEIFFPRHGVACEAAEEASEPSMGQRGRETVLVVEDERALLQLVTAALQERGYHVLSAAGPMEAIRVANSHVGSIDLLLTDLVMPDMNGWNLARTLSALRPRLRHLFMTGFAGQRPASYGASNDESHLLRKPFTLGALADKVRDVLDGAPDEEVAPTV